MKKPPTNRRLLTACPGVSPGRECKGSGLEAAHAAHATHAAHVGHAAGSRLVFHDFGHSGFGREQQRSEEHTSELQSLMRISYAVFCLKKKKHAIDLPPCTVLLNHLDH